MQEAVSKSGSHLKQALCGQLVHSLITVHVHISVSAKSFDSKQVIFKSRDAECLLNMSEAIKKSGFHLNWALRE